MKFKKKFPFENKNLYEWHWEQLHSCGHKTHQACLGGTRPVEEYKRLRGTPCPKCRLDQLVDLDDWPTADEIFDGMTGD